MPLFRKQDRDAVGAGTLVFAVLAVFFAFFAFVFAIHADNKTVSATPSGTQVTLSEFSINPTMITAPVNGKIEVTNAGSMQHNFAIENTAIATKMLNPGESATVDLKSVKAGQYTVYCQVADHRSRGMTAMLHVGTGGGGANDPSTLLAGNAASDALMKQPVDAYVAQLTKGANTKGVGNQKLAPKILPDGTKEFDLTASVINWEVAPGKIVKAWAFNNQVPGPWMKVNVGDKVKIVLDNQLPQSTAIHFHGIETPNDMDGVPYVSQANPVAPGHKFTYAFTAKGPAMGMYHSHHHAEHQVPDGLVGVFEVGDMPLPPNTGPVTQEVPLVLNDAGAIGFSLNGKSFPATAPIIAHVGQWVEINYYNEGLAVHPMHLHGMPQLVIAKDGFPVPNPYQEDTVLVAPGERYTVLVHATSEFLGANGKPGIWAFHCHILNHSEGENGMFGMVTTFIVEP